MTHPLGWGLEWLLGKHEEVLDVAPDAVGLHRQQDGARLVCHPRIGLPPADIVPVWLLKTVAVPAWHGAGLPCRDI